MLPDGRVVRVRGVQVHGRDGHVGASAPRRVAVNLGARRRARSRARRHARDAGHAGRDASRSTRASSCSRDARRCGTARACACITARRSGSGAWRSAPRGRTAGGSGRTRPWGSRRCRPRRRTRLRAPPPANADRAHARRSARAARVLAARDDRRRHRPRSAAARQRPPAARHARPVQAIIDVAREAARRRYGQSCACG